MHLVPSSFHVAVAVVEKEHRRRLVLVAVVVVAVVVEACIVAVVVTLLPFVSRSLLVPWHHHTLHLVPNRP